MSKRVYIKLSDIEAINNKTILKRSGMTILESEVESGYVISRSADTGKFITRPQVSSNKIQRTSSKGAIARILRPAHGRIERLSAVLKAKSKYNTFNRDSINEAWGKVAGKNTSKI